MAVTNWWSYNATAVVLDLTTTPARARSRRAVSSSALALLPGRSVWLAIQPPGCISASSSMTCRPARAAANAACMPASPAPTTNTSVLTETSS